MAACVDPYTVPATKEEANFLVVDGFLNGTTGVANVKLTHAIQLDENVPPPAEAHADVKVESESGQLISLTEIKDGIYQAEEVTFDTSKKYRLRIKTSAGASYSSDLVPIRQSPVLDSVSWRPEATGTRIYVSGHDPANQTIYYRYLFTETWEYRSELVSYFKKVNFQPVYRQPNEQVYTCWNSTFNQDVLTTSTKRLSSDRVSMFPVRMLAKGSLLLGRTYSINVQQRAITQEEYEYWELIKKTTQSLGGLFDPLPSQVVGNVHNENDVNDKVLGFFTGGFVQEKRIFIGFYDLPGYLRTVDDRMLTCLPTFIPINHLELVGDLTYLEQIGQPPTGYTAVQGTCADCRALGGDTLRPKFWPNDF